jgi:hypothetical protein
VCLKLKLIKQITRNVQSVDRYTDENKNEREESDLGGLVGGGEGGLSPLLVVISGVRVLISVSMLLC